MTGTTPLARLSFGAGLLLFAGLQIAGLARAIRREGRLPGLALEPFRESTSAIRRGDRHGAARELRAGTSIHRYNISLLLWIIEAEARAGDRVGSRQAFERAAQLAPGTPEVQAGLGWVLFAEQRWGEAELAFRGAVAARPGYTGALAGLGEVLIERDRFAEAADVLSRAVSSQPDLTNVRSSLGIAYALSGRPEFAVREFATVARSDPSPGNLANLRRAEAAVREAPSHRPPNTP